MEIQIRPAVQEDAEQVAFLSSQLGYDMTANETKELILEIGRREQNIIYVALAEGMAVGWIHAFITARLESGVFCEIGGLVVSGSTRNKGVAHQLVENVKNWSRENKIAVLRVRCNKKRLGTHQFYLREGFMESKQQKVFELRVD